VVHVSEVIHDMCIRLGHYAADERDINSPEVMTRLQLGCALEHAIASRYALDNPDRYIQVGELSCGGIYLTPDLFDTQDWAVEEIKLTWESSAHEPYSQKYWKRWVQVMAYCYALHSFIGRLHVCNMVGDYRGNRSPVYRVWEYEYTQPELDNNWRMLMNHREVMGV
jgi:hypothetical protein